MLDQQTIDRLASRLDEAERSKSLIRAFTLEHGLEDERPAVITHWREEGTWLAPPVIVSGPLPGSSGTDELLVGFTRL